MDFLEIKPDLELFFSLFQAKGVWKGLWINLNSTPGFSIFKLYKSSFKDFKEMFLKVKSVNEEFPFYLDENLGEKFPLYWCCHPQHILGPDLINSRNECIISFLIEMVDKGGLISVSDLLSWEENKAVVVEYFAGNFPGVTASSLRSRFKSKNFEGSSSNVEKADGGAEVDQPLKKKSIVFKKRKSDAVAENEGPEEERLQLDDLPNFVLKQEKLHSFDEDEESSSVWCKKFPFGVVADEVVQSEIDKNRVEAVGDVGVDQYLQVLGFRLASIGRSQEKKHRKGLSEASKIVKLKEELVLSESSAKDLKKKLTDTESKLKVEKECHERISALLKEKENDLSSVNERLTDLSAKMKKFEENKQGDILDAFAEGFVRAVNQAKFLFPDGDFGAMDPAKVIRDGKLVDDEEVSENDNLAD
ncbi:uncharacterized protein LOC127747623 [Arachis duranensis]|uniref:Uncharacterized protein LOC127747623 n=1 Tax=Arachis duranensis TaxID=130453 RepID=A0A9C6TJQ6_ARADU|nr:uncharacterized protein LOC127747623 [Arachis duranensis]